MDALIKIDRDAIGGETVQTVDARKLHSFLGVGRDFSSWIKGRITEYGFVEGQDFVVAQNLSSPNPVSSKARAQRVIDYHLTLDMAKELSMVERTDKGREARRYFIECERIAKGQRPGESTDELSSPMDRLPLYLGVARLVILRRLMFSTAYSNVSLRVGLLHFREMTKRDVVAADGFIRRVEAGTATPEDFRTIQNNRVRLLGIESQLRLIED